MTSNGTLGLLSCCVLPLLTRPPAQLSLFRRISAHNRNRPSVSEKARTLRIANLALFLTAANWNITLHTQHTLLLLDPSHTIMAAATGALPPLLFPPFQMTSAERSNQSIHPN